MVLRNFVQCNLFLTWGKMVISCAAVNCTNRQGKVDKNEISFHRFPIKNVRRLAKWKQAVRRENWMPNKYSFLCSKHFTPESFLLRYEDQHRQLKASAVPSIFDFSPQDSSTRGSVRKKLLAVHVPQEEEKKEDILPDERPRQPYKNLEEEISVISTPVKSDITEPVSHNTDLNANPKDTENLPIEPLTQAQQTVGEWSYHGAEEIFVPSSRSFVNTLHSYSSTSRQQQKDFGRRCSALNQHGAEDVRSRDLLATSGQEFPLEVIPKQSCCKGSRSLVQRQLRRRAKFLHRLLQLKRFRRGLDLLTTEAPLNPAVLALDWLLGSWESDEPGEGSFPTIAPFRYTETLHFSHVGQPVINFMFNAFHAETKKPLHRECGFIRMQPGTNRVAFIIAQNSGLVEVEEGELMGHQLSLQSQVLGRTSFAKQPHVQQISRQFQLRADGKLEQTVSMATGDQPLTQHLHITYRRSSLQA